MDSLFDDDYRSWTNAFLFSNYRYFYCVYVIADSEIHIDNIADYEYVLGSGKDVFFVFHSFAFKELFFNSKIM